MTSSSTLSSHEVSGVTQYAKSDSQVLEWEKTQYTKIPRGWRNELANFLRFIGLGILVSTVQGTFQKDYIEPKKVTIVRSRVTALLRALVHVFPMGLALLEITVVLRGHYLGQTFSRQSSYQLAAKAHEITANMSLASIILSYIRSQLLGRGLPFGAFLGSLQFTSVSYLWSRELWSTLFATGGSNLRKWFFFLLVLVCGIIAATIGPSSATLLIPRQLWWSVDPTYILINGTREDLYPDRIDARRIPQECSFIDPNVPIGDPLCPGTFSQSIYQLSLERSATIEASGSVEGNSDGDLWGFLGAGGLFVTGQLGPCSPDHTCSDRDDYTAEKTSRPLASGRDDFITAKVM